MYLMEFTRQLVSKYYPRDHLYIAGGLVSLIILLPLIPGLEKGATVPDQVRIHVPADTPVLSGQLPSRQRLTAADYVVSAAELEQKPILEDVLLWQNVEVKSGDNLSAIFTRFGLSDQDIYQVVNSSEEAGILNRLYPGYQLDFMIPERGRLEQLRVLKSPLEGFLFKRGDSGFDVETILKEAELQQSYKVGAIADSLFMAGRQEQIPTIHIMEMADIFGGVIDFVLDPRTGDQFSILYEEQFLDGEFIGNGEILATRFINQGETYTAVRYINDKGQPGYYSPTGESMNKAFLRNPMDVFRISSNFNPRRRHPILNTIRAHKGTDYAAPRGTPVRATGDGQITYAGRYGSFGNLVTVQHTGSFETKYAHLSRFGPGIRRGSHIRQGEIIGYVGSTGSATGPHLHYEFLVNGVHQNSRTILDRLPKAESIDPVEMDHFRSQTASLLAQFEELNSTGLLTLNQPSAD